MVDLANLPQIRRCKPVRLAGICVNAAQDGSIRP